MSDFEQDFRSKVQEESGGSGVDAAGTKGEKMGEKKKIETKWLVAGGVILLMLVSLIVLIVVAGTRGGEEDDDDTSEVSFGLADTVIGKSLDCGEVAYDFGDDGRFWLSSDGVELKGTYGVKYNEDSVSEMLWFEGFDENLIAGRKDFWYVSTLVAMAVYDDDEQLESYQMVSLDGDKAFSMQCMEVD